MPRVANELFCLIPIAMFGLVAVGLAKLLTSRTRFPIALSIALALLAGCVLSLFVGWPLQTRLYRKVQAQTAQPYVQAALDQQCGSEHYTVERSGFYIETFPYGDPDSGLSAGEALHWRSGDGRVDCVYSAYDDQWACTCP
jgi:hypothetical protein